MYEPVVPPKDWYRAKVIMMSRGYKGIEIIRQILSKKQLEIFAQNRFRKWLGMSEINRSCMLLHFLSIKLVKTCPENKEELWSLVNGSLLKFIYKDWCAITGLDNPISNVDPVFERSGVSQKICNTFLEKQVAYRCYQFFDIFKSLQSKRFDDTMMVKLGNLFFVECILLRRDKKTNIPHKHTLYADEYDLYVKYPWGRKAYLELITDFKKKMYSNYNKILADKVAQPGIEHSVEYNLHGCPLVLQVWADEVFGEFAKKFGLRSSVIRRPYILDWASNGMPFMDDLCEDIFRLRKKIFLNPSPFPKPDPVLPSDNNDRSHAKPGQENNTDDKDNTDSKYKEDDFNVSQNETLHVKADKKNIDMNVKLDEMKSDITEMKKEMIEMKTKMNDIKIEMRKGMSDMKDLMRSIISLIRSNDTQVPVLPTLSLSTQVPISPPPMDFADPTSQPKTYVNRSAMTLSTQVSLSPPPVDLADPISQPKTYVNRSATTPSTQVPLSPPLVNLTDPASQSTDNVDENNAMSMTI